MQRAAIALAILLNATAVAAAPAPFDALAAAPPEREVDDGALPDGVRILHQEPRLGLPTFVWAAFSREERPAGGDWEAIARAWLLRHAALYRLPAASIEELLAGAIHDTGRGAVIVPFERRIEGIPVFRDAIRVVLDRRGGLIALSGYLPGGMPERRDFALAPADALAMAAVELGAALDGAAFRALGPDAGGFERWEAAGLPRPARIRPVYFHLPDALRPAWHIELQVEDLHYAWVIDAHTKAILWRRNLVQDAGFRVWADGTTPHTPWDGPQGTAGTPHPSGEPDRWQAPAVPPSLVTLDAGPISTGDPWLPPGATETVGNNVDAYVDVQGPDGLNGADFRATTTAEGLFDRIYDVNASPGASTDQRMASITHLFYVTNWLHDWFYDAGFDEAAGNAQHDNYDRGGAGGDRLLVEAQDFSGRNNANMGTPADGASPRMQLFVFDANFASWMRVVAPANAATAYSIGLASFGPDHFDITGPLVLADDGVGRATDACEPLIGDYTGAIVLVDRGICPFADKAMRAQEAGAIGIVIANDEDGGAPGMSGDDAGHAIPVVSVRRIDGQALRDRQGLTVRLYRERAVDRDAALDTSVVAHEFAHMVTSRLIGNASGLGNNQGGSMGEGWSDFVALLLMSREEDVGHPANLDFGGTFAIGGWVHGGGESQGYYYGMRRYPYSANLARNPLTFRHVQANVELPPVVPLAWGRNGRWNAEVHRSGEVWATMLWDCYVALLRRDGDLEAARALMLELLVASLKITPADPTFLEARDAVLAAAWAVDPAIYADFWAAFARRGAGVEAVAPDRWSTDHAGVVESFEAGNHLRLVSALLEGDDCDGDGILDAGEMGTLLLRLHNDGIGPLTQTTAAFSSPTAGLTIGEGNALEVPASLPFETVEVAVPVALASATAATPWEVRVVLRDPALAEDLVIDWGALAHYDLLPGRAAIDTVELERTVWTPGGAVLPGVGWTRTYHPGSGWRWSGPTPGARSDAWLVSPPLQVSEAERFRISFLHRHDFETRAGFALDGGLIEISEDGQNWLPVEADYDDRLYPLSSNPLRGRWAFAGRNDGWPSMEAVELDLGDAWAGRTVRIRFRVGSDDQLGARGWEIDDIAFEGIDNLPFPTFEEEVGGCGNQAPVAAILGPARALEMSEIALDGSASSDADWDELAFSWSQIDGPPVEWIERDGAVARLRTPAVDRDEEVVLRLEVSDGTASDATTLSLVVGDNLPPVVVVRSPIGVAMGDRTGLDASASYDPEGMPLTFAWSQVDGPSVGIAADDEAIARIRAPREEAELRFQVVVSDGSHEAPPAEVVVIVGNEAPEVEVPATLEVAERERVVIEGRASDPDGHPLSVRWEQIDESGIEAVLEEADTLTPTLVAPDVDGDTTLVFSLVASDGQLESLPAVVEVLVREVNREPIAAPLPPLHVRPGDRVVLDASASEDPDGEPIAFRWRQVDGPAVRLEGADEPAATFTAPDVSAVLAFELELADPRDGRAMADLLVHVSEAAPRAGGCGCSGTGPAGAVQLLAFGVIAFALRRRRGQEAAARE